MNMKYFTQYILKLIFVSSILLSCKNDFEPNFEKSATERMNQLLDSCTQTLISADNGWEMLYYVNANSKGYNLLLNFMNESNVLIAGDHPLVGNNYTESTSTFETNNSNGPLLAFDTYNDVLHPFADPDGASLNGDFEFVIMNVEKERITLKGKMNATQIIMNPLPSNITFNEYFDSINTIKSLYYSTASPNLVLNVNGDSTCTLSNGNAFIFKTLIDTITYTIPFAATLDGCSFYLPETITGYNARNFVFNDTHSLMVSTEAPEVTLTGPNDLAGYFENTTVNWYFEYSLMSDEMKSLYNKIKTSIEATYSGASNFYLALVGERKGALVLRLGFKFSSNNVEADLYFSKQVNTNSHLTLSYNNTGNSAGKALVKSIDGFSDLANLLSSTFNMETYYPISMHQLVFTDNVSDGIWFNLTRSN